MDKKYVKSDKGIQERFLSEMCRDKLFIRIYLVSGIRLEGYIKAFDQNVVYLDEPVPQIIYKSAICSVIPSKPTHLNVGFQNKPDRIQNDENFVEYENVGALLKKLGV